MNTVHTELLAPSLDYSLNSSKRKSSTHPYTQFFTVGRHFDNYWQVWKLEVKSVHWDDKELINERMLLGCCIRQMS